jgi:hypothetical protein
LPSEKANQNQEYRDETSGGNSEVYQEARRMASHLK